MNGIRARLIAAMKVMLPHHDPDQGWAPPFILQLTPHLVELAQDTHEPTGAATGALPRMRLPRAGISIFRSIAPSEWLFRQARELSEASEAPDHVGLDRAAMLASWGQHTQLRPSMSVRWVSSKRECG